MTIHLDRLIRDINLCTERSSNARVYAAYCALRTWVYRNAGDPRSTKVRAKMADLVIELKRGYRFADRSTPF